MSAREATGGAAAGDVEPLPYWAPPWPWHAAHDVASRRALLQSMCARHARSPLSTTLTVVRTFHRRKLLKTWPLEQVIVPGAPTPVTRDALLSVAPLCEAALFAVSASADEYASMLWPCLACLLDVTGGAWSLEVLGALLLRARGGSGRAGSAGATATDAAASDALLQGVRFTLHRCRPGEASLGPLPWRELLKMCEGDLHPTPAAQLAVAAADNDTDSGAGDAPKLVGLEAALSGAAPLPGLWRAAPALRCDNEREDHLPRACVRSAHAALHSLRMWRLVEERQIAVACVAMAAWEREHDSGAPCVRAARVANARAWQMLGGAFTPWADGSVAPGLPPSEHAFLLGNGAAGLALRLLTRHSRVGDVPISQGARLARVVASGALTTAHEAPHAWLALSHELTRALALKLRDCNVFCCREGAGIAAAVRAAAVRSAVRPHSGR